MLKSAGLCSMAASLAHVFSLARHCARWPAKPGRGPLAELTFWQERSAVCSSLYEQLSLPIVKTVQTVVEKGSTDHNLISSFKVGLLSTSQLVVLLLPWMSTPKSHTHFA